MTTTLITGLVALIVLAVPGMGQVNLIDDPSQWSVGIDKGGTKMALAKAEAGLAVDVRADGGGEDYPKVRRTFAQPQDWRGVMRLRSRLRVTCDDPTVRQKRIAFVFYDDQTRLPNCPGNAMKQQVIAHEIPVGRWADLNDWLTNIQRATIRQLDLYIYELPPETPHKYRWEMAKLQVEGVGEKAAVFDGQVFSLSQIRGAVGRPVASVQTEDGLELAMGSAGEVFRIVSAS